MPRPPRPRRARRVVARAAAALALLGVAFVAAVQLRWRRTFDVPFPALRASADPALVARGRYLAYGPAHCADCHVAPADFGRLAAGGEPPLAGGRAITLPVGTWYAPNLTPDPATGIGRRSDGQLARVLRHAVRHDGRALLGVMEFQHLADDDVVALLSFLRAQRAVRHAVPDHRINLVGRALAAFAVTPAGPRAVPPRAAPAPGTPERGAYVANEVAGCDACHTERHPVTGAYLGAPYAGGTRMPDELDPRRTFVTPNLTAAPGAGPVAAWSEAQFVARLRAGRRVAGSPMEWEGFSRTSDDDLRAVYRYLRGLGAAGRPPHAVAGVGR